MFCIDKKISDTTTTDTTIKLNDVDVSDNFSSKQRRVIGHTSTR